jgi:hypothetical protein
VLQSVEKRYFRRRDILRGESGTGVGGFVLMLTYTYKIAVKTMLEEEKSRNAFRVRDCVTPDSIAIQFGGATRFT